MGLWEARLDTDGDGDVDLSDLPSKDLGGLGGIFGRQEKVGRPNREGSMARKLLKQVSRLGLVLVMGFLFTVPCLGQVDGPHLTVGPTVGYADWSKDVNLDNGWHYGGRLGLWLNGYLGIEGHYGLMSAKTLHGGRHWIGTSTDAAVDQDLNLYGGNVIFNISPTKAVSPFLLGGWQEARYDKNDVWPEETFMNGPQVGAGLFLWPLPRVSLRAEVRDWMWDFQSPPAPESSRRGLDSTILSIRWGSRWPSADG